MKKSKLISFIFCFSLILVGILSTIDYWCFNKSFYYDEYSKLNTAQSIGMSSDDLNNATDTLLDYLKDKRDDLIVKANINGVDREVFNNRETLHMVDVKDLYQNVMLIRNIFLIISFVLLIYLVFSKDNKYLFIEYKKALLFYLIIFSFSLTKLYQLITLLDYLKDKRDDLIVKANINGVDREVFNNRETLHMVDVKDLYQNVILIRNIFLIISFVLLIYLVFSKDNKYLFIEYKKALLFYLIIFSLIGIFCLIDFNSFWTGFHHVFFPNNDLWLLDPRTDILIMMVPEKFFYDLCISIVVSILALMFIICPILKFVDRKYINEVK